MPTNTTLTTANTPQWANVKPFALTSQSQFRAAAPPALTSAQYETAVKTTQAYGYHLNATGSTTLSTGQSTFASGTFDTLGLMAHLRLNAEATTQE